MIGRARRRSASASPSQRGVEPAERNEHESHAEVLRAQRALHQHECFPVDGFRLGVPPLVRELVGNHPHDVDRHGMLWPPRASLHVESFARIRLRLRLVTAFLCHADEPGEHAVDVRQGWRGLAAKNP